jgi:hypothetical protein
MVVPSPRNCLFAAMDIADGNEAFGAAAATTTTAQLA